MGPISGPIQKEINTASYYKLTRGWRQKPPFRDVLPYSMQYASLVSSGGNGPNRTASGVSSVYDGPARTEALTKAYGKFRDAIAPHAALAVTLAEHKSAFGMIEKRSLQIFRTLRSLRRGRFSEAARELGIKVPKGASRKKQLANNWLEYSFGWKPLIGDISDAVDVLQRTDHYHKAMGRAVVSREFYSWDWTNPVPYGQHQVEHHRGSTTVKLGAMVRVSNPNVSLANQLGFVNLAAVAIELIPWSFVVNWFVNVDEFVNQWTDLLGLEATQAYTTTFFRGTVTHSEYWPYNPIYGNGNILEAGSWEVSRMDRQGGIATVPLALRFFKGFSPARAANALSLVVQQLKGGSGGKSDLRRAWDYRNIPTD